MLEIREEYLDIITKALNDTLKGNRASSILIPNNLPDNELRQLMEYFNQFIYEYDEMQDFIYSISRGELEYEPPKGKMKILQSFKSLQASLKHLTWKTQQISNGDFNQKVDFMGDFSAAFNKMTEQLKEAFEKIEKQKIELAQKNRKITDSIEYAKKIQKAILPTRDQLYQAIGEHFVLYKPKDIVSGDFYWCSSINGLHIAAIADCTGHGVPGGFLTIIGNMLINKIVLERKISSPSTILAELNEEMKKMLKQDSEQFDFKSDSIDGMDIALILKSDSKVYFSGGKRPLYIIRKSGEIERIKGDNCGIGGRQKKKAEFTEKEISIGKGDMVYMLTDGFVDQNNRYGEKYGSWRLEEMLKKIYTKSMEEQQYILEKELIVHMHGEEQRDDITIIGIRG